MGPHQPQLLVVRALRQKVEGAAPAHLEREAELLFAWVAAEVDMTARRTGRLVGILQAIGRAEQCGVVADRGAPAGWAWLGSGLGLGLGLGSGLGLRLGLGLGLGLGLASIGMPSALGCRSPSCPN